MFHIPYILLDDTKVYRSTTFAMSTFQRKMFFLYTKAAFSKANMAIFVIFAYTECYFMRAEKEIETLTIEEIRDRLSKTVNEQELPILVEGFTVLAKSRNLFDIAMNAQTPYRLPGIRIGLLTGGTVNVTTNLINHDVKAPTLAFFSSGSILQLNKVAAEGEVQGMMIEPNYFAELFPHNVPPMFNGQLKDAFIPVDNRDKEKVEHLFLALTLTMKEPAYNRQAAQAIITALCYIYNQIYEQYADKPQNSRSRERELFDGFIRLVNEHGKHQHTLSFYADRLCITYRYLSRVIQQVSGTYAKEWIDRAIVTEAKVMLKHSNLSVAAIAEELHFANPSFFNKYFKRLTGMTPNGYREKE